MRFPFALLAALAAASLSAQTPLIDQGKTSLQRGDVDGAVSILEKAVEQSPNSAEAHYYLGGAYGEKAQKSGMFGAASNASKAKNELEKAVELNPKYIDARFALLQFYAVAPGIMGGSYDKAFDQAKAIKALDAIQGHRAYAYVYTQQKKPELAKKEWLDAVREQPTSPRVHSALGQYLASAEKNYAGAFAEIESAIKLDPAYMPAYFHLGRVAAIANTNLSRGEETLKKYAGYTPKDNEPTLASTHYWLGMIFEKQGKKAEARQSYQAALKLNPGLKQAEDALKRVS